MGRALAELRLLAAREARPDALHRLRLRPAAVPVPGQVPCAAAAACRGLRALPLSVPPPQRRATRV